MNRVDMRWDGDRVVITRPDVGTLIQLDTREVRAMTPERLEKLLRWLHTLVNDWSGVPAQFRRKPREPVEINEKGIIDKNRTRSFSDTEQRVWPDFYVFTQGRRAGKSEFMRRMMEEFMKRHGEWYG